VVEIEKYLRNRNDKSAQGQICAQSPQQRFESLQVVRALAAMMVVVFHMNVHTLPDTFGVRPLWTGLNMGYAGVEIFFVLSGFIMFFRHRSDFGEPQRVKSYLYARFGRIFPVFWIVMFGVLALRYVAYQSPLELQSILISALLLPIFEQHVLGVQWTLSFEMLFYLVFCLAILNTRLGILIMALWFGICITFAGREEARDALGFFFSPYNILFLFGIISAMIWRKIESLALPFLLVGTALFFAVGLSEVLEFIDYNRALRTILYGLAAVAIICGTVSLESQNKIRPPSFLVFFGNASYAIYLVHITAMSAASLIIKKLGLTDLPVLSLAIFAFMSALFIGSFVHILVEKPIMSFLRGEKATLR